MTNLGANVSIIGGEGNDTISNTVDNVTISGDIGTDIISLSGGSQNVTVNGGKDNDTIYSNGNSNLFRYSSGDGNDVIYNFDSNDTVQVASGNVDSVYAEKDGDVIIKVGSANIRLKNKVGQTINIKNSTGKVTSQIYTYTEPTTNKPTKTPSSTPTTNEPTKTTTRGLSSSGTTRGDGNSSQPLLEPKESFYDFIGDNRRIADFKVKNKIKLSCEYKGFEISGNNFVIQSASGSLTLENARDKIIDVADGTGNTAAYVYLISGEGDVKGSSLDMFEVIVASEGSTNHLISGSGGSSLVGGSGVNILEGGAGQDTFIYKANNYTITNYQSGEILKFEATYTSWVTDGNDLVINSAEGSIRIREVTDKLVELAGTDGNVIAHVYKSGAYAGAIDVRGFGAFEVIVGSDNVSNQIFADAAGSSLWGGRGVSNDDLYGNLGIDEYIYSYGNGNDNVFQAGNEDIVNLLNISFEQIVSAEITDNGVNVQFNDGGSLNISGQVENFKVGETIYHSNYQSKLWS